MVREASVGRHVAQCPRVLTPARGFDPWRSSSTNREPPCGHEMFIKYIYITILRSHYPACSGTGIAYILSAVRWGARFLAMAIFFVSLFFGRQENKTVIMD